MFWIVGGKWVTLAVTEWMGLPPAQRFWLRLQMNHAGWKRIVAWDMIMPTFLFVVGAAIPLAMAKREQQGVPLRATYERIVRRVVVLWVLGIFVQAIQYESRGVELYNNTLQAIAVGHLVTSIALLHLPLAGQIGLLAALVFGYWGLLTLIPFGGERAAAWGKQVAGREIVQRDRG